MKTIVELTENEKMDLFRRMVQTGAMVASLVAGQDDRVGKAMCAVEVAGTVEFKDIREGVSPVAAAHQLVDHCLKGAAKPDWLPI